MRTREQVVDELLVLSAQMGDGDAFESLAARWHPRLLRYARRLIGDQEGAEDVVQEAWLAVVKGLRRLTDPACFGAWALRIVTRRCADWIARRQQTRNHARALGPVSQGPFPTEPGNDERAQVREGLRQLTPDQRALMVLCYVEGLTLAEIARILKVPVGTVKSRLYQAREQLRAALEA